MRTQPICRPGTRGTEIGAHVSRCSLSYQHSAPARKPLRPITLAHASASGPSLARWTSFCAQRGITCIQPRLNPLRSYCRGRSRNKARFRWPQGVCATASRPRIADPPRKQQQQHRGLQRPLLTRHWCWEWRSSRWRASFLFLLGENCHFIGSLSALDVDLSIS